MLVPAELKLIELGREERVRDTRTSFQAATEGEFIAAVEQLIYRKVRALASAVDVRATSPMGSPTFEHSEDGERGTPDSDGAGRV